MTYRQVKHRVVCWTRAALFELAAAQVVVGFALLAVAYLAGTGEPPVILWMSALALVFSGLCTMAVAAIDQDAEP